MYCKSSVTNTRVNVGANKSARGTLYIISPFFITSSNSSCDLLNLNVLVLLLLEGDGGLVDFCSTSLLLFFVGSAGLLGSLGNSFTDGGRCCIEMGRKSFCVNGNELIEANAKFDVLQKSLCFAFLS